MTMSDTPRDEFARDNAAHDRRVKDAIDAIPSPQDEVEQLRKALGVCVDRLTHGPLPGNAQWWDLSRPLLNAR